ncbi:MAG: flagellar basal body P-ring formation protein FlgA [Legionellales bacterium]|nr:flagellar basal body P-ring formation protein FlgA [Legionellales bacterium]
MFYRWLSCTLLLLIVNLVHAQELQSHGSIQQQVTTFLKQHIKINPQQKMTIEPQAIDTRLQLPHCKERLHIFLPSSYQQNQAVRTVGVSCKHPKPWSIYISVKIAITSPVVVLKRSINRGEKITEADVMLQDYDINQLRFGYFSSLNAVDGMIAKQAISTNSVVLPQQVEAAKIIKRGQSVIIEAHGNSGIHVEMRGKALEDGALNQRIPVMNQSSKRTIEAVVVNKNRVRVPL